MGYIKHNAIIVTGIEPCETFPDLQIVYKKAKKLFGRTVTKKGKTVTNGFQSFLISPDGSKERWEWSNEFDIKRDKFFKWLRKHKYYVDVVEVRFGGDDYDAEVVRVFPE